MSLRVLKGATIVLSNEKRAQADVEQVLSLFGIPFQPVGQQNPVTALFLVTDDGSDPPMMDVLGFKASKAHHIVDPHLGVEVRENYSGHLLSLVERY